ncbi:ELWxxDGT repeat protein [Marinobacter confluentis]|uniref:Hyalin n=1 Tax=Marinobacter confluentis TaxID=1697557 RepID=A0A4Z1C1V0_9GAMM|nr:ELWxxDGT repeat protein [Marinobacter confluentis]TGN38962.1 hypothetical protein E5Q11_14630 [Marinobacter confluentis]
MMMSGLVPIRMSNTIALLALAVMLAACGDSDGGDPREPDTGGNANTGTNEGGGEDSGVGDTGGEADRMSVLLFSAYDPQSGPESLWGSDGTAEGTRRLADARSPDNFYRIGDTVFFTASSDETGPELWKTDGTEEGTELVKDINPGGFGSAPSDLQGVGDTLYFRARVAGLTGLWRSDGTEAGTEQITGDFNAPAFLTVLDGLLYFSASTGNTVGRQLWRSDGTAQGSDIVKDFELASNGNVELLTALDGTLYFRADDGTSGSELWRSDGTESGTYMVRDINPEALEGFNPDKPENATQGSSPSNLTAFGGVLYFTASNGTQAYELWRSDGTEGGTYMVKDIDPGADSSSPRGLTAFDGALYFVANKETDNPGLWRSDGTESGTELVTDTSPSPRGTDYMTAFDDAIYYKANDGTNGFELWRSDGSEGGTLMVKDINPAVGANSSPENLTVFDGALYFSADDGVYGRELWRSDGTEEGTELVKDICDACDASPRSFFAFQ